MKKFRSLSSYPNVLSDVEAMTGVNDDVVGTGSNDGLGWDDVGNRLFDELLPVISKDLIIF